MLASGTKRTLAESQKLKSQQSSSKSKSKMRNQVAYSKNESVTVFLTDETVLNDFFERVVVSVSRVWLHNRASLNSATARYLSAALISRTSKLSLYYTGELLVCGEDGELNSLGP